MKKAPLGDGAEVVLGETIDPLKGGIDPNAALCARQAHSKL
jgi:hypothetical protein